MMEIFRLIRNIFLMLIFCSLCLISLSNGEYIGEKIAIQNERISTGRQIADPVDPWPMQKFFWLTTLYFGFIALFFQSIIIMIKLYQEKKYQKMIDRIVLERDHPFRTTRHVWWGKGV